MLGLGLNKTTALKNNTQCAKAAGAVLCLDARKATGLGLPTNSPLTSPWVDLSGLANNATPESMAGTTASGVDITDPIKPTWVFDGTSDHFTLTDTASLDITSAPLAIFVTIKVDPTMSGTGYIVCKNLNASTNIQYGLSYFVTNTQIGLYLEGASRKTSTTGSVPANTWYNVGFIWDGSNVKAFVNGVQSATTGTFSGTLTSQPNMRIGRRETPSSYYKGSIATLTIYAGVKATEANILKAERAISRAYIGG
jgi:hypothetical protein